MKIFRYFLTFFIVFFLNGCAFSNEVTFTAISNANIQSDKINNKMTPSISNLLKAKKDINSSGSNFVVFLGDNTSKADKYDLVMFGKIINKISKPIYAGIGNNDISKTKNLDKKEYYRLLNKFSKNKIYNVPCEKNIKGFVFVFMDGINEMLPQQKGYYREKELIWLEKILSKYKNKNVIILQHFPITVPDEKADTTAYKVNDYITILKRHKNVKAIVSGHLNKEFELTDENGIKHISVPSLSHSREYKVISLKTYGNNVSIETKTINLE